VREPPPPGAAVPFTAQLADQIEAAWHYHTAGQTQQAKQVLANLLASISTLPSSANILS
jgi:hypothetical protein